MCAGSVCFELGSAPDWIIAFAALVATFQGVKSLTAWRSEAGGKRRLELAEEVLTDFYQARDIYRAVRSPMGFSGEGSSRPGRDNEPEDVQAARDTYYPVLERLSQHAEFTAKLNARKYRVKAIFGEQATGPFEKLNQAHIKIVVSARQLMRPVARHRQLKQEDLDKLQRWEDAIWFTDDEHDEVGKIIDEAIFDAEQIFQPIIQEAAK